MVASSSAWYNHICFRLIITAALLLLCFAVVNPGEILYAIVNVKPAFFISALILNSVGTILAKAWIGRLATRASGLKLKFWKLVQVNLITRFYTIALPRGASAAIKWHHYKKGGSGHAAAALLLFENLVSIFTLFLSAAIILGIEFKQTGRIGYFLFPLACFGSVTTALILLPFLHYPTAMIFIRIKNFLFKGSERLSGTLNKLIDAIINYHTITARRVGSIFLISVFGYVFFILSAWVLAEGMGLGLGLLAIAWVRSLTLLVALMPITVAGLGLREGALITLLSAYGVSPSAAFAYAIASFVIQLFLGLVGAVLEAFRLLKCSRNVEEANSDLINKDLM